MATSTNFVSSPGMRQYRPQDAAPATAQTIAPELFRLFQNLIYKESGIFLATHKTSLLISRLNRRLHALGLSSLAEYHRLVARPEQQHERVLMIDCITTNETQFFREPHHFEFLAHQVFPRLIEQANSGARSKSVRIWSAGCSTGEEPYSLAMLLLKYFPPAWNIEVLASDISTRVLEKARTGIYSMEKAEGIPKDFLRAFMLKGFADQEGMVQVGPETRKLVRFLRVNLQEGSYPFIGLFDMIFCRNVLIYFDQDSKTRAIDGMLGHLSPAGLLFVGHSEALQQLTPRLKPVAPSVYAFSGAAKNTFIPLKTMAAGKK
jgi:chemotaxis protein methyltransferase CheR